MKKISKKSIGVGLRIPHYEYIFKNKPRVDFFEIISENFMGVKGLPLENLKKILQDYKVSLHGTSLGVASADPLSFNYLDSLKELCQLTETPYFTDHLCWSHAHGVHYHDLLPIPYTKENADYIAEKIKIVQDYIGLPFGIENLSSYVEFKESEMTEWEFYNYIVQKSGAHYMLDFNNIFVSSKNQKFNPNDYVDSIDYSKVLQCHVAGHTVKDEGYILDTHDQPVCAEVWELYQRGWEQSNGFPTLLEWDDGFMGFEETYQEAIKAKAFQKNHLQEKRISRNKITVGVGMENDCSGYNWPSTLINFTEPLGKVDKPSIVPPSLKNLQENFGSTIKTPLTDQGGQLTTALQKYNPDIEGLIRPGFRKSGKKMISIYNEQYWYRLLSVMQDNFPLLRHIHTVWQFNFMVMDFLNEYPSSNHSLNHLSDSFETFLKKSESPWSSQENREVAEFESWYLNSFRMEQGIRQEFSKLEEKDLTTLFEKEIHFQSSFKLFEESWNVVESFFKVYQDKQDVMTIKLVKKKSFWGLLRKGGKVLPIPLSKVQFNLLTLIIEKKKLENALDTLLKDLSVNEINELEGNIFQWFGGWAVQGLFVGE